MWPFSFAGRVILTRSVTSTIPNYVMQCNVLPAKILQGADRLSRNFLWGSSKNKKKVHLISWDKIAKPREEGGLGIHAAKPKNTALLAKLNWRFNTEKASLGLVYCLINIAPREGVLALLLRTSHALLVGQLYEREKPLFIRAQDG